jgi:hypothetical protein
MNLKFIYRIKFNNNKIILFLFFHYSWTKAEGNSPKDFKPIVSNPHLQVYENGSLTFVDARDVDRGYYLCAATNNIGTGI